MNERPHPRNQERLRDPILVSYSNSACVSNIGGGRARLTRKTVERS
jgi:hypothetical protein